MSRGLLNKDLKAVRKDLEDTLERALGAENCLVAGGYHVARAEGEMRLGSSQEAKLYRFLQLRVWTLRLSGLGMRHLCPGPHTLGGPTLAFSWQCPIPHAKSPGN